MPKQLEMELNDPKHPIHSKAVKVIEIDNNIKELGEKKGLAIDELIEAMIEYKKFSITIAGITLMFKQREPSKGIQIIRPK